MVPGSSSETRKGCQKLSLMACYKVQYLVLSYVSYCPRGYEKYPWCLDPSMRHQFKVWTHQRGNQKPYVEEEQTIQWQKQTPGQTTIYKTLHIKHKSHTKTWGNSCAPEWRTIPALLVTPVVLLKLQNVLSSCNIPDILLNSL